jgi:hypothetical protein
MSEDHIIFSFVFVFGFVFCFLETPNFIWDFSDYLKDHPLYDESNKKVIGKFKDELNGEIMKKMYF